MKKILRLILFVFFSVLFFSFSNHSETPVNICSWNLKDFGKTKSDAEIEFIANTVKDYDIVLIQEVVAKYEGYYDRNSRTDNDVLRSGCSCFYFFWRHRAVNILQ